MKSRTPLVFVLLLLLAALAGCKAHTTCRDLEAVCERCADEVTKAECMDYVEHGSKDSCAAALETYTETCPG